MPLGKCALSGVARYNPLRAARGGGERLGLGLNFSIFLCNQSADLIG